MSDMSAKNAKFVQDTLRLVSGAVPSEDTVQWATRLLDNGCDPRDFLIALAARGGLLSAPPQKEVPLFVEPGHFYSPIVNPQLLVETGWFDASPKQDAPAIEFGDEEMEAFFGHLRLLVPLATFPDTETCGYRYFYRNDFFGAGDAIILSCMIRHFRPKRIVEVGSGFSSAVILDTIGSSDYSGVTECTFIEPNPERLHSLISDSDRERTTIVEHGVQLVPMDLFENLESGDILFFDTTHVAKTGSDVNFDILEILPRIRSGVIVHFHDVFDRFEYPMHWIIDQNRSWNELYMLRAFLMYNTVFRILYFNQRFVARHVEMARSCSPRLADEPGGSLWLRKMC